MAEHHPHAPISQEDIDRAHSVWAGFTKLLKVAVGASIVALIGMALFLV